MNVSKNDALAWPQKVHRDYPSTVNARMESTIRPFIQKSIDINMTIMEVFNERLGLPKGALAEKHTLNAPSGCESRVIKNPPRKDPSMPTKQAIGAHCDFGSLVGSPIEAIYMTFELSLCQSFLHNRLGGLQVLPPGTTEWKYVKVSPRLCIYSPEWLTFVAASSRTCDMQRRRCSFCFQRRYIALQSPPCRVSSSFGGPDALSN